VTPRVQEKNHGPSLYRRQLQTLPRSRHRPPRHVHRARNGAPRRTASTSCSRRRSTTPSTNSRWARARRRDRAAVPHVRVRDTAGGPRHPDRQLIGTASRSSTPAPSTTARTFQNPSPDCVEQDAVTPSLSSIRPGRSRGADTVVEFSKGQAEEGNRS